MKPRTLVVHVDNDQWLVADKAQAAVAAIPGAQYAGLSSPIAHYAVFSALNTLRDDPTLDSFVRDIGLIEDKSKVCTAANYRNPRINMKPDPAKSFWKDAMVSPFPVKYARSRTSAASNGRSATSTSTAARTRTRRRSSWCTARAPSPRTMAT